jgi:hypothetical protein
VAHPRVRAPGRPLRSHQTADGVKRPKFLPARFLHHAMPKSRSFRTVCLIFALPEVTAPDRSHRPTTPSANGRYLRIPAEDPRRFGSDSAIWSPMQSGIKLGSHR